MAENDSHLSSSSNRSPRSSSGEFSSTHTSLSSGDVPSSNTATDGSDPDTPSPSTDPTSLHPDPSVAHSSRIPPSQTHEGTLPETQNRSEPREDTSPLPSPQNASQLAPRPENADSAAHLLAKLVASGVPLSSASSSLSLDSSTVERIVSSAEWPALIRSALNEVNEQYDEDAVRKLVDPLVPRAISLKTEILADENASLDLRDRVASEVLKIAGLHRTRRKEVHVFVHPAPSSARATIAELIDDEDS